MNSVVAVGGTKRGIPEPTEKWSRSSTTPQKKELGFRCVAIHSTLVTGLLFRTFTYTDSSRLLARSLSVTLPSVSKDQTKVLSYRLSELRDPVMEVFVDVSVQIHRSEKSSSTRVPIPALHRDRGRGRVHNRYKLRRPKVGKRRPRIT